MSFYVYRATSGVGGVGSRALGGPIGASRALENLGLFDPRGSLWSLLLDRSVGASEAWPLCARPLHPLTEVILIQTGWLTRWV